MWLFRNGLRAALVATAMLAGVVTALAQDVVQLPGYIDNTPAVTDLGNGPQQLKILSGAAAVFTSQSSGVRNTNAAGMSTTIPLTAVPATPPCVGCLVSGTQTSGAAIPAGVRVTAYDGVTGITISSGLTIAAGTTISWGAACPSTVGSTRVALLQAGVGGDPPLYTQARLCATAQNAAGAAYLSFPIGAH